MQATALNPPKSPVETEVLRIRGMLEKNRFAEALAASESLLSAVPENRDVWYMIAVSQRYLRRIPDALATLKRFEAIHPNYSRLHQERGHCQVAARDPSAAMEAYLRAVTLNPALPASWKALHLLFGSAGQTADAETSASHVAKLASLPVPIVTATSMLADGEIHEAGRVVRQFLQTHANDVEGMRLLAQIDMKLDALDEAESLLESALALAPDYHLARHDYANVLLRVHRHAQALEEVRRLLQVDPGNRSYRTTYAAVCAGVGDHELALQEFRRLSAECPQAADLHLSIAHSLKTLGRQQESIESYRTAAAHCPSYGDAYWSLANLKTYRFMDEEIERMRREECSPGTSAVDRYHLCFALGKALEDRAEYPESFRYYARGNLLKKDETQYRPQPLERAAQLQASICTREFFDTRRGVGSPDGSPIFVVGLPRAGSTLLEQILASHSQVEGTMELADIPRLVHKLQGRVLDEAEPRYPGILADLDPGQFKQFGEKYIADTQVYRKGKPFFIDKMPNNFRHIGLIHLILPNAKIIDARREPMACCFSNFKQLFASGQEFTYGLDDLARYYRSYVELMRHWDTVLPGKILRVQHEDVVNDLEGNVRRLLDFCSLEFDPACLEFYKTERSVRTASSEQVRRPLFKEGLDQWRNFESWLRPLRTGLGDLVE
jgi:tetratricopeptide (TPR) repeat protein